MSGAPTLPTREKIISTLAFAAESGYLGVFVGSGFSKAATGGQAPGFEELLIRVAERLDLSHDFAKKEFHCKSLPQIASQLLHGYIESGAKAAEQRFREAIAGVCNLEPHPSVGPALSHALRHLGPAWFITTNYDLILEHLLEGAPSVLANQPLAPNTQKPPIYHLHGHRYYPSTLRITEEDYVSLLAPIDYQRLRLPLLLRESTTLMLGYALGDINVRAAVEWAKSFQAEHKADFANPQGVLVQALYAATPAADPYAGPNGETILEIASISGLLNEVLLEQLKVRESIAATRAAIAEFLSDPNNPLELETNPAKREFFLNIVKSSLPLAQSTQILEFLSKTLEPIWTKAREDYGFDYYNVYLSILLDVAERLELTQAHPRIVAFLGESLDRIGWYFHPATMIGYAWEASATWIAEHGRLPKMLKQELASYAVEFDKYGLRLMLRHVEPALFGPDAST